LKYADIPLYIKLDYKFLLKEKDFKLLGEKNPNSNVEFAIVNEEWSLYVFLDHKVERLRQN